MNPAMRVRARWPSVLVVLTALLLQGVVFVSPAYACSCAAPEPRDALADADAAFVGVVIGGGGSFGGGTYTFEVEHDLKGNLADEIDVAGGESSSSCALGLGAGDRVGLLLSGEAGHWTAGLCSTIDPAALLAAGQPYPAPDGRGPIHLLVGGGFGVVRILALDARGRTLAYGVGEGNTFALDVCPGGAHVVEAVEIDDRDVIAVRETATLGIVREIPVSLEQPSTVYDLDCLTADGTHVLAVAGIGELFRALEIAGSEVTVLLDERGAEGWVQDGRVYAANEGIVRCLPSSGPTCDVDDVAVPSNSSNFRWSPDRSYLAGLRYLGDAGPEASNEVIVVDPATGAVRAFALGGSNDFGDVSWVDDDTVAYLPGGGDDETGILIEVPDMLAGELVDGWYTAESLVADGRAVGVGWGTLMWMDLDSGRLRSVELAGDTWAVATVGGSIEADPQAVPDAEIVGVVGQDDVAQRIDRSLSAWLGAGLVTVGLVGLVLVVARRSRRSAARLDPGDGRGSRA